ncbi:hypothetical protein NDU88_001595 [Pleurodeles waltl]|uniref:Pre-C2HC domain-containing protein n=1 Tax=Pleurodeles waltl TaxID=8319 RepID=A0AAV7UV53_PLEWA|nr:hypothetical protein NDU88_001595 [Pleurodeles waltl]
MRDDCSAAVKGGEDRETGGCGTPIEGNETRGEEGDGSSKPGSHCHYEASCYITGRTWLAQAPKLAGTPPKSFETANRFQALQHIKECDTNQQGNETTGTETAPCPTKRLQIPPIILKNLPNHNDLVELLEKHCTSTFMIKPQQHHAKIMLTTPEDYRSLTTVLMEKKLEYHTFSLTTVKAQHFVILPANASLGHITCDLSELGLPVKNIMQIASPTDTNKKFPLFIVTMSASRDGKPADLSVVTRLCSCPVTTEGCMGKRVPVMCYNWGTPLLSAIRNQGVNAVEGNIPPTNAPRIEKQKLQYVQTVQETISELLWLPLPMESRKGQTTKATSSTTKGILPLTDTR